MAVSFHRFDVASDANGSLVLLSRKTSRRCGKFRLARRACDWLSVAVQTVREGWDGS